MYQHIMFCSDLYPSSDYAFLSALDLAERSGARLTILHVLESRHRYSGHAITYDGEVWPSSVVFAKLRKNLEKYYHARIETEPPQFVDIEIRAGIPWMEILRFARKWDVDLIVLAPFTVQEPDLPGNWVREQVGPTTQRVSLKARCQVSIVTSPKQRLALEKADEKL